MVKRSFGREFKLQVVRQWIRGEKRLAQLCREHNLSESLVRRWREQYEQQGEDAWLNVITVRVGEEADPQAKIIELEAALGRAHLELELLRRALQKGGCLPGRNGK